MQCIMGRARGHHWQAEICGSESWQLCITVQYGSIGIALGVNIDNKNETKQEPSESADRHQDESDPYPDDF